MWQKPHEQSYCDVIDSGKYAGQSDFALVTPGSVTSDTSRNFQRAD